MDLLQLRYFYTVGKMLNISHAAKIHRIPQPAMSKMISNLESDIGVKLFDRTKNHLSLTPEGHAFLPEVEKALCALDSGVSQIQSQKHDLSGDLRLSVLYHRNTIVHCIERFLKDYPGVNFSVFNDWSTPGPFDLFIGGPGMGDQYDSTLSLLREEIRLAVPIGHHLASKASISIDDLRDEKFIVPSLSNQMFQIFSAVAKDAGYVPTVSIASNDLYCIQQYFTLGIGVSLVPRFSWSTLFNDIGTVIPFETPIYRTVHMYWNMHVLRKPGLEFFKEYVEEEFRQISQNAQDERYSLL